MKTLFQLNTRITDTPGRPSNLNEPITTGISATGIRNLQSQVTLLANSIRNESVRIAVAKVFADLVFLLDYLSLVDGPQEPGHFMERFSILHAVRSEACALVDFIENHAMQCEGMDELLNETLDGSAYAIKHEVRRIFDVELAQANFDQDDPKLCGSLLHAQGVLINCFQQCMIGLARVFDDSLTGARLFHDWKMRRERSLLLCHDLAALIDLVQDSGKERLDYIADQLESFREGSMQWLMYKDYHDYEALAEKVIASIRKNERPAELLHRLGCYLETLLAHVKTRAVLADVVEPSCAYEEMGMPLQDLSESPTLSLV